MTGLSTYLLRELSQRGWSQRKAAIEFGIPVQTLNDIIRNPDKDPDLSTLRKLAAGLKVTVGRLLQVMGEDIGGAELPRPIRGLSDEQLAALDQMDDDEFAEFVAFWEKFKGGRR